MDLRYMLEMLLGLRGRGEWEEGEGDDRERSLEVLTGVSES